MTSNAIASHPHRPGNLSAVWLVARIATTRLLKGKLTYGAFALMALPLVGIAITKSMGSAGQMPDLFRSWLDVFLPLGTLLLSYDGVSDEVESGSAVFIWTSGRPRWVLPIGKLLASWILATLPGLALVITGDALAGMPVAIGPLAAAVVLSCAAYSALGLTAGALVPRHAMATALATGAVLNLFVVHIPGWATVLSPAFHVRNLAGLLEAPGKTTSKFFSRPDVSVSSSALFLAGIALALALTAAARVTLREYRPRA